MSCSEPPSVLSGQHRPGERQPQMDTSCSTRSPAQTSAKCQLCVEKCVLTSVSVVFYWVPENAACVCTSKSVQGGARSYIGSCKPPILTWTRRLEGGGGISGMHLGLVLLLPQHLAALSHYRGTTLLSDITAQVRVHRQFNYWWLVTKLIIQEILHFTFDLNKM